MSEVQAPAILLVEDNPGDARLIREMLVDELGASNFQLCNAANVAQAIDQLGKGGIGMVLLDLSLPDSFGLDTFSRIQEVSLNLPIVVLTGNQDQDLALSAVKAGAQDFLVKNDLTGGLLVKTIHYARERKQIEASLRVSEARFRSLAELSSDWYWEQDADARIRLISGGLKEKSGIDPQVFLGRHWWSIPGFEPEQGWAPLRRLIDDRQAFKDLVVRLQLEGAIPVYISISGSPVLDDAGVFAGYRGVGKDVSARERVEADLRGSEERYRSMMDTARDGIFMVDDEDLITFANRRVLDMLALPEHAVRGRKLDQFMVREESSQFPASAHHLVLDSGAEVARIGSAGERQSWAMVVRYPVHGRDGVHAGTLAIITDLTEFQEREARVRQLAALAAERSEAQRANEAKSRFLAAVSHDLRQPMHALGLFIDDLKAAALPDPARDLVKNMESALGLTNSLLDALLVMSRLESGLVVPNVIAFPVQPVLSRLERTFGPVATARSLALRIVPSTAWVQSDPTLLERMLANLISNALRYTDRGGVVVGCRRRAGQLRLEVWDTGLGILPENLAVIFQEFYRVESDAAGRSGLGLGLAIVQSLSHLLAHPVDVTSTRGRGSRFAIRVNAASPLTQQAGLQLDDDLADLPDGATLPNWNVLVIDDDADVLARTCRLLERWGMTVRAAGGIRAACDSIRDSWQMPDLVVADLHMSAGETGTEAIRIIRTMTRPDLPAIIVTGDTSLNTARAVKALGIPMLYKPLVPGRLATMIRKIAA